MRAGRFMNRLASGPPTICAGTRGHNPPVVKSEFPRGRRSMAVKARRQAVVTDIGGVKVGGNHPIVVQSMTNTDTADVPATVNQVMALARAGSELVRVTVNTEQAAAADPKIVDTLAKFGVPVPIIGDFHYN